MANMQVEKEPWCCVLPIILSWYLTIFSIAVCYFYVHTVRIVDLLVCQQFKGERYACTFIYYL